MTEPGGRPSARACALCGAACRVPFVPPPAETAPDLDLRPGEPTRSTLPRWLQTCRGCGACAPDLARLAPAAKPIVASADYKAATGPARAFLRWAMIAEATLEPDEAGQAMLEAAWALDDAGVDATALRRRAAALWQRPATMQDSLRLVDVLRRAGEFDAAAARASALLAAPGLDETDAAILHYQQDRITEHDTARHLLSSALRPPAQRPHVTHGQAKPPARGLWQRLTGR
jgi:hypothetical protein